MRRLFVCLSLLLGFASIARAQGAEQTWTCPVTDVEPLRRPPGFGLATIHNEIRIVFVTFPGDPDQALPTWSGELASELASYLGAMSRGVESFHVSVITRPDQPALAWLASQAPSGYYAAWGTLNDEIMTNIDTAIPDVWSGVTHVVMIHYRCVFTASCNTVGWSYLGPGFNEVPGFTGTGCSQWLFRDYGLNSADARESCKYVTAHELGHTFGFGHSPRSASVGPPESDPNYVNMGRYDCMRAIASYVRQEGFLPYHPAHLYLRGWLPKTEISTDTEGVRLSDLRGEDGSVVQVNVPGSRDFYWLVNQQGTTPYDQKYGGTGLLAWHMTAFGWDLETAEGRFNVAGNCNLNFGQPNPNAGRDRLENCWSYNGGTADFYPGFTAGSFSCATNPNTNQYLSPAYSQPQTVFSGVAIDNILRESGTNDILFDVYFTPRQKLVSPNGGEILRHGTPFPITWTVRPSACATSVELRLSTDGGATYPTLLAGGLPNSGSYSWTPDLTGQRFRIQVVSRNAAEQAGSDVSDDDFAITKPGKWVALSTFSNSRREPSAVFDPVRHRVLLFGGTNNTVLYNDLQAMSAGGSWSTVRTSGTPPSPRRHATAVYDPVRDRMLLFGGYHQAQSLSGQLFDLWSLDLKTSTWSSITPPGSPPTLSCTTHASFDPIRDRLIAFDGMGVVYALPLTGGSSWQMLAAGGLLAAGGYNYTAAYDSLGDRIMVFGGWMDGPSPNQNNMSGASSFPLSGPLANQWQNQVASGTPPARRSLTSLVYDPARDRLVAFGGEAFRATGHPYYGDTWELDLGPSPRWFPLSFGTSPGPLSSHAAVYDRKYDRMVVAGGESAANLISQTWILTWDAVAPSAVELSSTVSSERIEFSWTAPGDDGSLGEPAVYQLRRSGSTITEANWSSATLVSSGPSAPRAGQQRVVHNAGACSAKYHYAVRVRDDGYNWGPLSNVTPRIGTPCPGGAIHEEALDPEVAIVEDLAIEGPNPARGPLRIRYSIPEGGTGSGIDLAVFDVAGRRVATLAGGTTTSGRKTTLWDLRNDGGGKVGAGVYFVRLRSAGKELKRSVIVMP